MLFGHRTDEGIAETTRCRETHRECDGITSNREEEVERRHQSFDWQHEQHSHRRRQGADCGDSGDMSFNRYGYRDIVTTSVSAVFSRTLFIRQIDADYYYCVHILLQCIYIAIKQPN